MHQICQPPSPETAQQSIGGKANRLLELQLAGFRVPSFVCAPIDVEATVAELGTPLVVRSSASGEDGNEASFAGQFKSILNLRSADEVKQAIYECRLSLQERSVADYCREQGIDHRSLKMTVIVQRMIEPELAGVAFTVNPMNGREEVVIEACEGLGDALLQGTETPLDKEHPLLKRYTDTIKETALAVQRHFGEPQDIEFAIQDGEIYVLQARPITRINFSADTGEWTNADFRDGGVACTVCTPLMWSLYKYIWQDALNGFLRDIKLLRKNDDDFEAGRLFFGRPYWNLGAVKKCLSRLPGFIERKFDEDLQVKPNYEGDGTVTPMSLRGILGALPILFAVPSIWKRQMRKDKEFLEGGFDTLIARYEQPQSESSTTELREMIEGAYRTTETNYFRTVFCASLAKLDFAEAFPDATDTGLLAGLPEIRHLEPTRVMREMAERGEIDVPELMRRFRHHSRNELDLRTPRWDEDPQWVEALAANLPRESVGDPVASYQAALERELKRIPRRKRKSFRKKLDRLRHFLWIREEMRDVSTRMYYLIRQKVLAVAKQQNLGEDVFYMTWQNIVSGDKSMILRNREVYENFRNFKAPNEIGSRFSHAPCTPRQNGLSGIGASPGLTRGIAVVARDVNEAMDAPLGAILVCPFTDPSWTGILGRVSAVVTETGGLLSHAAVICREYGIPAILGVSNVTNEIKTGDLIEVNGGTGVVSVVTHHQSETNSISKSKS